MKTVPPDMNPPLRLMMSTHQFLGLSEPDWIVQAPGRDMWIAAVLDHGHEYEINAADMNGTTKFSHRSAKTRHTVLKRPLPDWARYPAGVVVTLGDKGLDIPGFQAVVLGDEPEGPRYDYALGLVFAAFCFEITSKHYNNAELIDVVDQVRRDYVKQKPG